MRQSGCTPPMTSPSTSCPKQLNRMTTIEKRSKAAPSLLSPSTVDKRVFIFTSILFTMLLHIPSLSSQFSVFFFFLLHVSIMSSASTPVIPFREGIHGIGRTQTFTCSYTSMDGCTHLHMLEHSQGERLVVD